MAFGLLVAISLLIANQRIIQKKYDRVLIDLGQTLIAYLTKALQ